MTPVTLTGLQLQLVPMQEGDTTATMKAPRVQVWKSMMTSPRMMSNPPIKKIIIKKQKTTTKLTIRHESQHICKGKEEK